MDSILSYNNTKDPDDVGSGQESQLSEYLRLCAPLSCVLCFCNEYKLISSSERWENIHLSNISLSSLDISVIYLYIA